MSPRHRHDSVLNGSPYSLPPEAAVELGRLDERTDRIRSDVAAASVEARRRGLFDQVIRDQRYREVFESNQLEFEGPDLKATIQALQSPLARDMDNTLQQHLLPKLLADDRDLHAVIGLEAARIFAVRLLDDLNSRPLAEADIRSIHELVTSGHSYSGRYKRYYVSLGGDTKHEPVLPIDVPYNMRLLTSWNTEGSGENPILHAAALHAWLTHIHPFEDGNGRVARLLANLTLANAGLPPAIVKAKTHRSAYLDALATSDEGGDIMPLTGLFTRTLEQFAAAMQKPKFFRGLFYDLLRNRGPRRFDWWSTELEIFLRLLTGELGTRNLIVRAWDTVDSEAFELYREGRSSDATTVLMIEDGGGAQVAVQITMPSYNVANRVPSEELLPSIRFAVRSTRYGLDAYRQAEPWLLHGLDEVYLDLEAGQRAHVVVGGRIERNQIAKVAEIVGDAIYLGFASGRVTERTPVRSKQMPKVNGGPG